jgi:hypothetical protein
MVVLTGLIAAPHLNDKSGLCIGVDPSDGRLIVQLDRAAADGVKVKLVNVLVKPGPPPVSRRFEGFF